MHRSLPVYITFLHIFLGLSWSFLIFDSVEAILEYIWPFVNIFHSVQCPSKSSRNFKKLAKTATKEAKSKFDARIARKKQRMQRRGKVAKSYYTASQKLTEDGQIKRTFSGQKDLQSTAAYPTRFGTAVCKYWAAFYIQQQNFHAEPVQHG